MLRRRPALESISTTTDLTAATPPSEVVVAPSTTEVTSAVAAPQERRRDAASHSPGWTVLRPPHPRCQATDAATSQLDAASTASTGAIPASSTTVGTDAAAGADPVSVVATATDASTSAGATSAPATAQDAVSDVVSALPTPDAASSDPTPVLSTISTHQRGCCASAHRPLTGLLRLCLWSTPSPTRARRPHQPSTHSPPPCLWSTPSPTRRFTAN